MLKKTSILAILLLFSLTACSSYAPRDIDPDRLAYVILDGNGDAQTYCFDTISPNHCISGRHESLLKRLNPKHRILLQKYILVIGEPSQMDCNVRHPQECRLYFEHIYVDIVIDPKEMKQLKQQMEQINI